MLVKDLMTTDVQFCTRDTSLAAAARLMSEHECGALPVVDANGHTCGIITDRDICLAIGTRLRSPEDLPVGEVMSKAVFACAPGDEARVALTLMKTHRIRRLPVLADDGRLAGVVSIDDLVLRAAERKGAAVPSDELLDALKAICLQSTAAMHPAR